MKMTADMAARLLELSRSAYPREIAGLLLAKKGVINDLVILPGDYETQHVYVKMHLLPIYTNAVGTFHSHPSRSNRPSRADLDFFSELGRIHLIVSYPYELNSIASYDTSGKPAPLELIE
ncbi:MAG: Mov34/MPN/PAD-1 family protein [archaeon]